MKKISLTLIVAAFVVVTSTAFACPFQKTSDALKAIVTSPIVVYDNVMLEKDHAKFMPFGVIGGFLKGTFYMGKQILDGAYEIARVPVHEIKKCTKKCTKK